MKNTHAPTITTELVKNYRDDGDWRKLIPFSDTEMCIQYYITYLKRNTGSFGAFLAWADNEMKPQSDG